MSGPMLPSLNASGIHGSKRTMTFGFTPRTVGLSEPDPSAMRSAVGLVWRALVLWMILLLLLTTATFL